MTINEKEQVLRNIFERISFIDDKDKDAVIAYIRGTSDTRERMKSELNISSNR